MYKYNNDYCLNFRVYKNVVFLLGYREFVRMCDLVEYCLKSVIRDVLKDIWFSKVF